jgi:hypothetical protein
VPVDGPFTSIYRQRDKVVPWRTLVDPVADNVEVEAGHLRLVSSPTVVRIIAELGGAESASSPGGLKPPGVSGDLRA